MKKADIPGLILNVNFYRTEKGVEPVRDWLKSLPKEYRKAIGEDVKTVQFGWPVGMPVVRKLEKGLWEIRSIVKDGIARILFTTMPETMILLHGFVKKSKKTPKQELDVARRRMKQMK